MGSVTTNKENLVNTYNFCAWLSSSMKWTYDLVSIKFE